MRFVPFILVAALAASCSTPPANFAGSYTVAITNGDNGCTFPNWQMGSMSSGIPFTITQSGEDATGVVGGLTATFLDLWLGSASFSGKVTASSAELTLFGTRQQQKGQCSYTINATVDSTLVKDTIQGTITYTALTNMAPDCAGLTGCRTLMAFNGTRPPTP
jgi:hypothetical protein